MTLSREGVSCPKYLFLYPPRSGVKISLELLITLSIITLSIITLSIITLSIIRLAMPGFGIVFLCC